MLSFHSPDQQHPVTHIINYDFPSDIDGYAHCIGHTDRAGTGNANAFFNSCSQNIAENLL
jgi:ATP-dependent RNA helicase DDX3X